MFLESVEGCNVAVGEREMIILRSILKIVTKGDGGQVKFRGTLVYSNIGCIPGCLRCTGRSTGCLCRLFCRYFRRCDDVVTGRRHYFSGITAGVLRARGYRCLRDVLTREGIMIPGDVVFEKCAIYGYYNGGRG